MCNLGICEHPESTSELLPHLLFFLENEWTTCNTYVKPLGRSLLTTIGQHKSLNFLREEKIRQKRKCTCPSKSIDKLVNFTKLNFQVDERYGGGIHYQMANSLTFRQLSTSCRKPFLYKHWRQLSFCSCNTAAFKTCPMTFKTESQKTINDYH